MIGHTEAIGNLLPLTAHAANRISSRNLVSPNAIGREKIFCRPIAILPISRAQEDGSARHPIPKCFRYHRLIVSPPREVAIERFTRVFEQGPAHSNPP
jgi:hypothetical protein